MTLSAVVSKSDFARMAGVTPTRVGQWIREGKLGPDAMDGEGRFARIKVDVARQQLRLNLNQGQQLGNGLGTNLNGPSAPGRAPADVDPVADAIRAERLREMQYRTRALAEAELARRGTYVSAADAQVAMTKIANEMVSAFEGALADFAGAVAAQFQVPQRDVLHLLRAEFRTVRANAAKAAASRANTAAPLVADDVETAADADSVN